MTNHTFGRNGRPGHCLLEHLPLCHPVVKKRKSAAGCFVSKRRKLVEKKRRKK
jgi:hypothetical protein